MEGFGLAPSISSNTWSASSIFMFGDRQLSSTKPSMLVEVKEIEEQREELRQPPPPPPLILPMMLRLEPEAENFFILFICLFLVWLPRVID